MPDMPGMIYEKIEIVHSEVSELRTDEMGMLKNPPMLHWTPNCTQTHSWLIQQQELYHMKWVQMDDFTFVSKCYRQNTFR